MYLYCVREGDKLKVRVMNRFYDQRTVYANLRPEEKDNLLWVLPVPDVLEGDPSVNPEKLLEALQELDEGLTSKPVHKILAELLSRVATATEKAIK